MKLPKADNLVKAPDQLKDPYSVWSASPTQPNLRRVLDHLRPTIDSALTTYASGNISPITRGRAKTLAIKAVRGYDAARGTKLESHVMLQLQPLRRYTQQAVTPMKMSERRLRQLHDMERTSSQMYEELGRDPSDAELSDRMGLSPTRLGKIRAYANPVISLDAPVGSSLPDPVVSQVDPQEIWLNYVYHDLAPIDRRILDWKLGRNEQPVLRNVEIARRLDMSPSAITQRTARIQQKLLAGTEVSAWEQ
jgi:DNA-directed RNA polymerase specialized sigma subunit